MRINGSCCVSLDTGNNLLSQDPFLYSLHDLDLHHLQPLSPFSECPFVFLNAFLPLQVMLFYFFPVFKKTKQCPPLPLASLQLCHIIICFLKRSLTFHPFCNCVLAVPWKGPSQMLFLCSLPCLCLEEVFTVLPFKLILCFLRIETGYQARQADDTKGW